MNKKLRLEVYNKFDGLCAYCGKPLDSYWQVDHIHPKCLKIQSNQNINSYNDINNLFPTFKIINHYKRSLDLEGFRKYMLNFHLRLAKLPKNTNVPRTQRRKEYMFKIAELFDITINKPFEGIFYFEKVKGS
jgi:hypothetical protein